MRFIYLIAFILFVPALGVMMRNNPAIRPKVWFALGVAVWLATPYHLLFNMWPGWNMWPGYVKGLELSLADAIAMAMLFSGTHRKEPLRFKLTFGLYLAVVVSSIAVSSVPAAATLYVWQLARMALLVAAIARSCADPRAPKALMAGLVVGLFYNSLFGLSDYFKGSVQSGGMMGHQNLLGLMSHFVALPALALVLGGSREKWLWLGPIGGLIVVVVAGSRATFGLAIGAYVLMFLLSAMQGWSARKGAVSGLAMLALLVAAPLAVNSLTERFAAEGNTGDYDERAAFERAARMMVDDHPFGVGANQYTLVANVEGYSQRAGVVWNSGSRGANVHNIFYLFAAETGWLGAAAFILLLLNAGLLAFRYSWKRRWDEQSQLLLGLGVAIATVSVHSMFEWIMVTYTAQYLLAVDLGLIAGLSTQVKRRIAAEALAKRQARTAAPLAEVDDRVAADALT